MPGRSFRMEPSDQGPPGAGTAPGSGSFVLDGRHWEIRYPRNGPTKRIIGLIDRDVIDVTSTGATASRVVVTNQAMGRRWVIELPGAPQVVVDDALRAAREIGVRHGWDVAAPEDRRVGDEGRLIGFVGAAGRLAAAATALAGLLVVIGTILPAFVANDCAYNCDFNSFQLGPGEPSFSPQGVIGLALGFAIIGVAALRPRGLSRALWWWGLPVTAGVGGVILVVNLVASAHAQIPNSWNGGAPGAGVWLVLAGALLALVGASGAFLAYATLGPEGADR